MNKASGAGEADFYLIHGADQNLASEALDHLKHRLVGKRPPEMVVTELEGEGAIDGAVEAARTPAFVEGRRVIVVRSQALSADAADRLAAYLDDPSEDAVIIVTAEGRLPAKLSAALKEKGEVISANAPPPAKRTEFVAARARAAGLPLTGDAARYVAEMLGENVTSVGTTLAQLAAAYPGEKRLGLDSVGRALSGPRKGASWELTNAIERGDAPTAISYLNGLLAEGMHPLQVIAMLNNQFRRIARVAGRRLDPDTASAELGIKRYPAEKILGQARRIGEVGARRGLVLIVEAEMAVKGGSALTPQTVVEMLVVRLTRLFTSPVVAER